jgi:beta-propeller repeat-containing protein
VICLLVLSACAFAAPSAQLLPKAPVRFEPNQGQVNRALLWSARGPGYSIGFTSDATLLRVGERTVAMRFPGQDVTAPFEAASPYSVPTNYITSGFQGSVRTCGRLRRHHVYPGVDVVYYGNGGNLEYDFEVAAGADPSRIRMSFDGADELQLAPGGDLVVRLADKTLTQRLPVVYQRQASGGRVVLPAAYRIGTNHEVTFAITKYDREAALVIDPVISFATYPFGSGADVGIAIAVDQYGFIYVGGSTSSLDYPNLNGGVDVNRGGQDAFVMKLNPNANSSAEVVQYASFYGGGGGDSLKAMAVDPTGLVYLTGTTSSTDLITSSGAYKTTNAGGTDAFVVFLDPARSGSLTLVYATYLGGTDFDEATGITYFDGKIYVTGSTSSYDFPLVKPYQPGRAPGRDMFVAEIDPSQSGSASLVASTYFGGAGSDYARSILVDAPGHVFVAGNTTSRDFPVSSNAYQPTYSGGGDGFLTEFDLNNSSGGYSTYLGGSGIDDVRKIVFDAAGRIALTGFTSSRDFPITQNAYQPLLGGPGAINSFLAILDVRATTPSKAVTYSTFYGGSGTDIAWDLKRDAKGKYYLGGYSLSSDLPVSQNALNPVSAMAGLNGFIAVIDPAALPLNSLTYASYITGPGSQAVYGVEVDANGSVYVTGYTTSDIFPAGFQSHNTAGNSDSFVLVFKP